MADDLASSPWASEQLPQILRLVSQIRGMAHDPDAAALIDSAAQLGAAASAAIRMQQVLESPSGQNTRLRRLQQSEGPVSPVMFAMVPLISFMPLMSEASNQRPLSERALHRLPETTVTAETLDTMKENNSGEAMCIICHQDYEIGERLLTLPCEHSFCIDCGQQWLRRNSTCPVCRAEVEEERPESDDDSGWHTEDLFSFRLPQGSGLSAIRRARESRRSGELWPPVEEMARLASPVRVARQRRPERSEQAMTTREEYPTPRLIVSRRVDINIVPERARRQRHASNSAPRSAGASSSTSAQRDVSVHASRPAGPTSNAGRSLVAARRALQRAFGRESVV
eukprot:TRINITY_DN29895_c0_g1_i1.p1 TRINITY_DN29895_c0_g1~~TRINITY_DN29895_c0_g1_i1.p1  ORF type:complete len:340 (+),score=40.94 TRINITY_DN29895_c0_g1_i1:43-1062(+)